MPLLLYICIFFADFMCFDMSLLLLTVTLRGVSNKHCLLPLFHYTYLSPNHHYDPMIKAEDFKWLDWVYHLFYLASYLCLSGAF